MNAEFYQKRVEEMVEDRRIRLQRTVDGKTLLFELTGELGELVNAYKHEALWTDNVFLQQDSELSKTQDELGDVFWYLFAFASTLGLDVASIWERNLNKLEERYGEKNDA